MWHKGLRISILRLLCVLIDISMDAEKLKAGILAAVREYLSSEESYDDDAQLRIDPATMKIDLADGEEADDERCFNGNYFCRNRRRLQPLPAS